MFKKFIIASMFVYSSMTIAGNCNIENPYRNGSGHYAGFEWAERKDVASCGGKSRSYIEGCEEYLRQMKKCKSEE